MRKLVGAVILILVAVSLTGCITVQPGAAGGDLVVVGGNAAVPRGMTVGNAVAIGGRLDVAGIVRDSAVALGGDVIVRSGATVGGEAVAIGGRVILEEGAIARGGTVTLRARHFRVSPDLLWPALRIPAWIGLLVLALVVAALWGGPVGVAGEAIAREPARVALTGLLTMVGLPFALLLLVVTIIGIPLVPVVILAVVAGYFFGFTALAALLGESLLRFLKATAGGPYWPVVVGVVALGLLRLVPVVAGIAGIGITLLGIGVAVATRFGTRRPWPPGPPAGDGDRDAGPVNGAPPAADGGDTA